jgi:hypothetical protein
MNKGYVGMRPLVPSAEREQTMQRRYSVISLLGTVLAVLALTGSVTAGQQVPFKAQGSGVVTITGPGPSPPYLTWSVIGERYVGTHLGRYTPAGGGLLNAATGAWTGDFTWTAANGDKLFVTAVGQFLDLFHWVGDYTIVGGTGRFHGATGSVTQTGEFALPAGSSPDPYADVWEGTISSPGSNK